VARLWSSGFELQTNTNGIEAQRFNGTTSIDTTTKRAGTASLRCNPTAGVGDVALQAVNASTGTEHVFIRGYFYIATMPSATTTILAWADNNSTTSGFYGVHLKTDGTLFIGASGATSGGTPSSALSTGRWYRIEMEYDDSADTLKGYLNGTNFSGTLTGQNLGGGAFARWGVLQTCTADIYVDDVAVNDASGSAQNGLPGEGYIVHLKPDSAGDNTGWTTTVGGTANWNRVSEAPPNDATSYNATTASGTTTIDDFNMTSTASVGITSTDTIKLVQVGARIGSNATTAASMKYRVKSQASGTVLEGASVSCALNGWTTHDNTLWTYQLTSYTDPQAGGAWTPTLLDNAQIGYRTDVSQTTTRRVTTIWALVEFTKNYTQSNTESIGVTDTRAFVQGKKIDDTTGLTDAIVVAKIVNKADSVGVTDTTTLSRGYGRPISDTAGVTDSSVVFLSQPTEELTEDFSGAVDNAKWPDSYGTFSHVAGRGQVACTTGYSAFSSGYKYFLTGSYVWVRAYPVAQAGATVECWMQLLVRSSTAGTDVVMEYSAITNTVNMANRVGYFDAGATSIAYDATAHAYWRIREAAGTLYWETSPDAQVWTVRRSTSAPAWVGDGNLNIQLIAHRSDGTDNFAEFDNFNVVPFDDNVGVTDTKALRYGKGIADSENLTDSIGKVYNGIRTPADTVGITDSPAFVQRKVVSDTAGLTDTVQIAHDTVPVVAASTRPLIGLSVRLFDSSGAVTAVCPDLKALSWTEEVSQSGTISIEYPSDGVNYAALTVDRAEGAVFWGDYELPGTRFLVAEQARDVLDETGTVVKINAPAWVGKRLTESIVHPPRWPVTTPVQQEFNAATPGGIMQSLILQSQSRGVLSNLEWDFTATSDSNGNPWTQNVTMTIEVGNTNRQVLQKLVEMAVCDWKAEGRKLRMFNWDTMGTNRSGGASPVILYAGRDLIDAPVNRSVLDMVNTVFSLGEDGWSAMVSDAPSVATYGRIEGFISSQGVYNVGTLATIGNALIAKMKHPQEEFTHNVTWADPTSPNPYIDYFVGDKVLRSVNGTTGTYTIRQMTFSMDDNGDVKTTVTLNDKFYTQDILLSRKMDALTGGSASSTSGPADSTKDIVPPNAPTAILVNSGAYVGNGGVTYAAVTASWTAPLTNTDGSTMTDLDYYEVQWKLAADSVWTPAGTSDTTTLQWSSVTPGVNINVRVRAVDTNRNKSAWSSTASHTTASDTTPPGTPSTPTTTNYLGVIRVAWDGLISGGGAQPGDYAGTNVYISTVNGFTPSAATKVDTLPGAAVSVISALHDGTPLAYGTTYYVKLISFDRSGNVSAASAQTSATPAQVVGTDIGNNVIDFSDIRFKDIGNLIADGSFELATTATLFTAPFTVVTNPDGATAPPSPKCLRYLSAGVNTVANLLPSTNVVAGQKYVGIYSWRSAGFSVGGSLYFQAKFTLQDGSNTYGVFKEWNSTNQLGTWQSRQATVITVPANAVGMEIELYGTAPTGSTVYLDELEVRLQQGTVLIEDAAINNAKIANLAVNDAKISDLSVAKVTAGTISADWVIGARIKTANTGARVELNSGGIGAWNAGGTQTVTIASADGSVSIVGQLKSGVSGRRLEINPTATYLPEIRMYPNTGSNYAYVNAVSSGDGTAVWFGANSGTFTHPDTSETSHNRLFMLDGNSGIYLEMVRSSDGAQNGPQLRLAHDWISAEIKDTADADYLGFLHLGRDTAAWGINRGGTSSDAYIELTNAGRYDLKGRFYDYVGVLSNAALFTGSVSPTSGASSWATTFGPTMLSQLLPICSIRDNVVHSQAITDSTTSGFEVTISPAASGAWAVYFWCFRV